MELEGRVELVVDWDGRAIVRASVRSRRAQVAARLLRGLPPDAAAARVPLVFSLCARAQALAARLALLQAQGQTMEADERRRRDVAVAAETVHEALWRMLRDWPEWLGEAAATAAMVTMRRALEPLLRGRAEVVTAAPEAATHCRGLLEEIVLGEPLAAWRARADSAGGLAQWAETGATSAARLVAAAADLPTAPAPRCLPASGAANFVERLAERIDDEAFAAAPDWDGLPAETGVAQRQATLLKHGGAAARLLARIADAARAIDALAALSSDSSHGSAARSVGDFASEVANDSRGRGWALVDTARGQLLHVAAVAEGVTSFYRIVAPTEWNFHPQGALPGLLVGAPAASRVAAERLGVLAIQALDPCVTHHVEVVNA
ncbi:MAG TPA: nickel-dependent hydrogenase large subunit [Rhodocyclaceae bacterium]